MPFDTGEPYAIDELSKALVRLTRDGAQFLQALDIARYEAPQGDRWSPAFHLRHLILASRPLRLAYRLPHSLLRVVYGTPERPSRTFIQLRDDYRRVLAAGGKAGRYAPRRVRGTSDPLERRRTLLATWQRTNEDVVDAWRRWRGLELDRVRLPHPLLGKLTAREMAMFTVYHTSHHLVLVESRL